MFGRQLRQTVAGENTYFLLANSILKPLNEE